MDINDLVAKYVQVRDLKAKYKAEYEKKVEFVDAALTKIEGILLAHFNEVGVESMRTDSGTAFKATATSCTVADKDVFFNFVQSRDEWALADVRASKKAIETYKQEHGDLPPGINWRETVEIRVNRG